jgi:hypothetical protein
MDLLILSPAPIRSGPDHFDNRSVEEADIWLGAGGHTACSRGPHDAEKWACAICARPNVKLL